MKLSYWEYKTWISNVDFTVVGSGIVGLNCALALRRKYPHAKILMLEKGILPQGASTKNAGFACFGSISEILADLEAHSEQEVFDLVKMRWDGINLLRENLGDQAIDYQQHGGHELFYALDSESYELCLKKLPWINQLLEPVFKKPAFESKSNTFGFKNIQDYYLSNSAEGQIDTGKMMWAMLDYAHREQIMILNSVSVSGFHQLEQGVEVYTDQFQFNTSKLFIATNGFAPQILDLDVKPARAQVLITKPISGLRIQGTFHIEEGYYYFRNIDNRILLGGARNLDTKGETTTEFGLTPKIQARLEDLLREVIIPGIPFEIEQRWSGIMGMGDQKRPIVKSISKDVFCGIRLGGMGIAIGSLVGNSLADLLD